MGVIRRGADSVLFALYSVFYSEPYKHQGAP
uniref:Uncharacterized protein n=1 Tax=Klebsiella phage FKP3 TaxID=3231233 RepID=A0AAU8HZR8_9CAUD